MRNKNKNLLINSIVLVILSFGLYYIFIQYRKESYNIPIPPTRPPSTSHRHGECVWFDTDLKTRPEDHIRAPNSIWPHEQRGTDLRASNNYPPYTHHMLRGKTQEENINICRNLCRAVNGCKFWSQRGSGGRNNELPAHCWLKKSFIGPEDIGNTRWRQNTVSGDLGGRDAPCLQRLQGSGRQMRQAGENPQFSAGLRLPDDTRPR